MRKRNDASVQTALPGCVLIDRGEEKAVRTRDVLYFFSFFECDERRCSRMGACFMPKSLRRDFSR